MKTSDDNASHEPCDLLVRNAALLVTMGGEEIPGGYVAIRNGFIDTIGKGGVLPAAREELDASGCVVTPGLINTHQHFLQNLTRNFHPETCSQGRLAWILPLQKIWSRLDPEAAYLSAWVATAEHLLGGCTTAADHLNNHPVPHLVDAEIKAARETGIRLHAARGAMDIGEDQGGTTPRAIVQERDVILEDFQRLVDRYHQRDHGAFFQIALAPCNTYAASPELLRESASLAEKLDVRLHTHLSESDFENTFSVEQYGMRPTARLEANGWGTDRTWVAHATCLDEQEIACLGKHAIGVAHCPSANLLSFRRIAPVKRLELAGSPIGIGTDGGASAGHASLWMEARTAMQVGHLRIEDSRVTARDALRYATTGGAACLGRSHDLGRLRRGHAADLVVWPTDSLHFSGSHYDLVEALFRNGPLQARHTVVGGRIRVRNGQLQLPQLDDRLRRHHRLALEWQQELLEERNRPLLFPAP